MTSCGALIYGRVSLNSCYWCNPLYYMYNIGRYYSAWWSKYHTLSWWLNTTALWLITKIQASPTVVPVKWLWQQPQSTVVQLCVYKCLVLCAAPVPMEGPSSTWDNEAPRCKTLCALCTASRHGISRRAQSLTSHYHGNLDSSQTPHILAWYTNHFHNKSRAIRIEQHLLHVPGDREFCACVLGIRELIPTYLMQQLHACLILLIALGLCN